MRRRFCAALAVVSCGLLAASGGTAAASRADPSASSQGWGYAQEVPDAGRLNAGGNAWLGSMSCAFPGDCSAGGSYRDSAGRSQAFVVGEEKGTWREAQEVPGSSTLNFGRSAGVEAVSCPAGGTCGAGGYYTDSSGHRQGFVVSETRSTWGKAVELAGLGALNTGGSAGVYEMSCPSGGNCEAGGSYAVGSQTEAFVAGQAAGAWAAATEIPGLAGLNVGGAAVTGALSCPSPGNCSAGGYYTDISGDEQAFVASETAGTWSAAQEAPGTATLNAGGAAQIYALSCPSAGNCSAGGAYQDAAGFQQAFVVSEVDGMWGMAREVPGTATLNAGGLAAITSLSCSSAGNCGAGGYYSQTSSHVQAFVVSETSGTWSAAAEVPGTAALNKRKNGGLSAISCASAGSCSAGGYYTNATGQAEVFVITERGGVWGQAAELAGTAKLNRGGFDLITALSCGSAGHCSVGGYYSDGSGHNQVFVAKQT